MARGESKIVMLETKPACLNGFTQTMFRRGEEYVIGAGVTKKLADAFIAEGWATYATEEKMAPAAPQNKMEVPETTNKEADNGEEVQRTGDEETGKQKEVKPKRGGK